MEQGRYPKFLDPNVLTFFLEFRSKMPILSHFIGRPDAYFRAGLFFLIQEEYHIIITMKSD